jgi:hypothetical protein
MSSVLQLIEAFAGQYSLSWLIKASHSWMRSVVLPRCQDLWGVVDAAGRVVIFLLA